MRTYEDTCMGKTIFRTRGRAEAAAKHMKGRKIKGVARMAYKCPMCAYYHVGNSAIEREKHRRESAYVRVPRRYWSLSDAGAYS